MFAVLAAFCGPVIYASVRALRAGRWPLPGKKVIRRTEIIRGRYLQVSQTLGIVFFCTCLIFAFYQAIQLHRFSDEMVAPPQQKTGKATLKRPAGQSISQLQKVTASPSE